MIKPRAEKIQWIDIVGPTKKDVDWLTKKFKLHPVIAEELAAPSARSMVEHYSTYLFLIYYFPIYDPKEKTSRRTEIDFIVSGNTIATVRYDEIEALRGFEAKEAGTAFEFIYEMVEKLLVFQERQLRHIREEIEAIGKQIFNNHEREVLEKISYLKRDVSEYRIIAKLQGVILRSLHSNGKKFWGPDAEPYFEDMVGDHLNVVNQLEDCRETISDFEETNNQLMNLKINSVMKTLTSISFLTFPFMLLVEIFSMDTKNTPLVEGPYGFWIIVSIVVTGIVALTVFFKKKNWF